jgi:hypothetical protein
METSTEDVRSRYYGTVLRKVFSTKGEADVWAKDTVKRFSEEVPSFKFRSVVREIRSQALYNVEYEVVILARI